VSSEVPAQTEARLRDVFRRSQVAWLPGSWEFVEGAEAEGWLAGVLDPATSQARFHYLQVGVDGTVQAGESIAELDRTEDGRWQLTEHLTWSSGEGSGTNQLRQANA
jgi:hypothetical protein